MVQGVFDDLNPRPGRCSPIPTARSMPSAIPPSSSPPCPAGGARAARLHRQFQGGSPQGYSSEQPWHNSAFEADGRLRPDYAARMGRIVERADQLGMVVILGYFYFGQDQRLTTRPPSSPRRRTPPRGSWPAATPM